MNMIRKKFALEKTLILALIFMISSAYIVVSTKAHAPGFEIYSPRHPALQQSMELSHLESGGTHGLQTSQTQG